MAQTLMMFAAVGPVQADVVDGTSCDPDFLEVIQTKGWMEGKREMEVAQALITRPDSVLEYSCFTDRAADAGVHGGLVQNVANTYLNNNFSHDGAAGQYTHNGDPCELMSAVWTFTKCQNINSDLFVSFEDLTNDDVRAYPLSCSMSGETNHDTKWQNAVSDFQNKSDQTITKLANYMPPTVDLFSPDSCTDPIPTGLIIRVSEDKYRNDYMCPTPGCYYNFDFNALNVKGECRLKPGL